MLKANDGRVVVKPDEVKTESHGFAIAEKPGRWGTVVDVGPPMSDMHSDEEMSAWHNDGIHPSRIKEGTRVLLPKISTEIGELRVFWLHDIPCFEE